MGSPRAWSPSLHTVLPAPISVLSTAMCAQGHQRDQTLRGGGQMAKGRGGGKGTTVEGGSLSRLLGLQRQQEVFRKSQAPNRSRFYLGFGPDRGDRRDLPVPLRHSRPPKSPLTAPRPPLQDSRHTSLQEALLQRCVSLQEERGWGEAHPICLS